MHKGDVLDQFTNDMDAKKFLSEDFAVQMIFASLFASLESISGTITLLLKLLWEHPLVLQELTVCKTAKV